MQVVLGIDLSLTGLGLCAVPVDWGLEFKRVLRCTIGLDLPKEAPPLKLAERRGAPAADVWNYVNWLRDDRDVDEISVYVEGYPVGGRVFNLDKLAELGGVVKHELCARGIAV